MAKLTTAKRKKIPKSQFGLPGQKKYPMPDKAHAANAKARARQELNKGKITFAEYRAIINKANNKLGGPAGAK